MLSDTQPNAIVRWKLKMTPPDPTAAAESRLPHLPPFENSVEKLLLTPSGEKDVCLLQFDS
jgi:hypothetical protein